MKIKLRKYFVAAWFFLFTISANSAEKIYFFHNDHLGTPQEVTDIDQNVVWQVGDSPFGADAPVIEQIENNIRFPGQYYDAESGLHYNWNRYYDPGVGRYVSSDPIGLGGGLNTYGYVGGNPIVYTDPFGLAYFAKRRLSILPWLGGLSCNVGSLDDKHNTELSHEQLFFEDGKSPGNIGFGRKGLLINDSPSGYHRRDGGYDDCIMRIAASRVPTGTYKFIGNNCQDWAQRVRNEYNKIKNTSIVDSCTTCTP